MDQDKKLMSMVIDWKNEIGAIAGPFSPNDTKQSWFGKAARRCGVSVRHIASLYYGHVRDPKLSVATKVLSAADRARLEGARQNVQASAEFYRVQATRLESIDPDFYRDQIERLLSAAERFSNRDSTGNTRGEMK